MAVGTRQHRRERRRFGESAVVLQRGDDCVDGGHRRRVQLDAKALRHRSVGPQLQHRLVHRAGGRVRLRVVRPLWVAGGVLLRPLLQAFLAPHFVLMLPQRLVELVDVLCSAFDVTHRAVQVDDLPPLRRMRTAFGLVPEHGEHIVGGLGQRPVRVRDDLPLVRLLVPHTVARRRGWQALVRLRNLGHDVEMQRWRAVHEVLETGGRQQHVQRGAAVFGPPVAAAAGPRAVRGLRVVVEEVVVLVVDRPTVELLAGSLRLPHPLSREEVGDPGAVLVFVGRYEDADRVDERVGRCLVRSAALHVQLSAVDLGERVHRSTDGGVLLEAEVVREQADVVPRGAREAADDAVARSHPEDVHLQALRGRRIKREKVVLVLVRPTVGRRELVAKARRALEQTGVEVEHARALLVVDAEVGALHDAMRRARQLHLLPDRHHHGVIDGVGRAGNEMLRLPFFRTVARHCGRGRAIAYGRHACRAAAACGTKSVRGFVASRHPSTTQVTSYTARFTRRGAAAAGHRR